MAVVTIEVHITLKEGDPRTYQDLEHVVEQALRPLFPLGIEAEYTGEE